MKSGEYNSPTIMFVHKDKDKKRGKPLVVPVELEKFTDDNLEEAANIAIEMGEKNELEMILYAQFGRNHKRKNKYTVLFGCRDAQGNTLHRMYSYDRKEKKLKEFDNLPFFNIWTPVKGASKKPGFERFEDPILLKIATNYAILRADKG